MRLDIMENSVVKNGFSLFRDVAITEIRNEHCKINLQCSSAFAVFQTSLTAVSNENGNFLLCMKTVCQKKSTFYRIGNLMKQFL